MMGTISGAAPPYIEIVRHLEIRLHVNGIKRPSRLDGGLASRHGAPSARRAPIALAACNA